MSTMHNEKNDASKQDDTIKSFDNKEKVRRRHSSRVQKPPLRHNLTQIADRTDYDDDDDAVKKVGFFSLFRYATCLEWISFWTGILLAMLMGFLIPLENVVYGEFTSLLVERTAMGPTNTYIIFLDKLGGGKILLNGTKEEYLDALRDDSRAYGACLTILTSVQLIFGVVGVSLLNYVALAQTKRIRLLFLKSIIKQDITWFDMNTDMNFASKMSDDLEKLRDGIGDKVGIFVYLVASFISAVVIAFFYGWELSLVMIASSPIIVLIAGIISKVQSTFSLKEMNAYSAAGSVADEVLGGIKTVVAFGGEAKEVQRYSKRLDAAKKLASKKGLYTGLGTCLMWVISFTCYGIAFYYGIYLILNDRDAEIVNYTPASLMIIFFGVMIGAENMGMTVPHLETFNAARGAATNIFSIIERIPQIDGLSKTTGIVPSNMIGDICFEEVHFNYPARPSVQILQGVSLRIKSGKMIAIVGSSGCGKSTVLQLIQRLYDPEMGKITINNIDIKDINVRYLRSQISVVGQEPVLFTGSIAENIRFGRPDCTIQEIESAAKAADCHDFISQLPRGYDTEVGERGAQLSGGQKQRICVARALIRQPSILLLDEATSALDAKAQEKMLRNLAIAATAANITVINVTHRLSAISNSDYIIYMGSGKVLECGTHNELMKKEGLYFKLISDDVKAQSTIDIDLESIDEKTKTPNIVKLKKSIRDIDETSSVSYESDEEITIPTSYFLRILKLNSKEWNYILLGCIGSIVLGATYPTSAVVFGDVFGVLGSNDREEVLSHTILFCILYAAVGVAMGISTFVQMYAFSISGARLTARLREMAFNVIMKQEMAWYDKAEHSVGALCARLSSDCGAVQGASGTRIGSLLQACSTLVIGVALSFYYSWKMTGVSIITVPIVLITVFLEARIMGYTATEERMALENSTKIATEAINNIRTVASLGQEEGFIERYEREVMKLHKVLKSKTRFRGLVFSLGQCIPLYGYALALYYGGLLVANEELDYPSVIKVSECLIFGSWMLGQALAFAPNFNAAKVSASRLFELFDRKPAITSSSYCKNLENWRAKGAVDYDDIDFSYPNRPDMRVLKNFNLHIDSELTIALVGHSGCGKSTCIQLLQRFYDPPVGNVLLDDEDICEDLSLETLRSQLGIVSQEPVLFDKTIAENIAYGDNTRTVSTEEIIKAAQEANIHEFITSLPLGYDTNLGKKGAQLSGGQKQRIAIARALIRNPRVLLLDEATSALDTHSEKLVQEALDSAGNGRTCIIIAHRLSSVRRADKICVIDKGRVVEMGTHEQLLLQKGLYAQMYKSQLTNL